MLEYFKRKLLAIICTAGTGKHPFIVFLYLTRLVKKKKKSEKCLSTYIV